MKAIVVGGNGYVGQNLCIYLTSQEVEVLSYDIHETPLCEIDHELYSYQKLDITIAAEVVKKDWNADVVYFLAGLTGTRVSIERAELYTLTNEIGLITLLRNLVEKKIKTRIIFPSTRLVYKGMHGKLNEDSIKEFKTVYAINKYACEQMLAIFGAYYGINYAIFRICVPYASLYNIPFSYGTLGFMLKQSREGNIKLFGDGSQRRTFTHIEDITEILHWAASDERILNKIYNIGGEDLSLSEVAEVIAKKQNAVVSYVEWPSNDLSLETGDTVFDSSKLEKIFCLSANRNLNQWLYSQ